MSENITSLGVEEDKEKISSIVAKKGGEVIGNIGLLRPVKVKCYLNHEFTLQGMKILSGLWCPFCNEESGVGPIKKILAELEIVAEENIKISSEFYTLSYSLGQNKILVDFDTFDNPDDETFDNIERKQACAIKGNYSYIRIHRKGTNDLQQLKDILLRKCIDTKFILYPEMKYIINEENSKKAQDFDDFKIEQIGTAKDTRGGNRSQVKKFNGNFPKDMPRAIGYVRVSTDHQLKENSHSLEVQEYNITKYCVSKGLVLVAVYSDRGISGGKGKEEREALSEAIDSLQNGYFLVVASLTRFARKTYSTIVMIDEITKKRGANLCVVDNDSLDTSTQSGKNYLTLLSWISQFERDTIVKRVTEVAEAQKEKGTYISKPRFGYKIENKKLVEDEKEQLIFKEIIKMIREKSSISYNSIANKLNEKGTKPPRTAKKWYASAIRDIVIENNLREKANE